MRYLILSDIHANDQALKAVLQDVKRHYYNRTIVLGDIVGYGAGCNESVELIRRLKGITIMVRGNHDKVAAGLEDGAYFNITALSAILWTREVMTEDNMRFIREMPEGPKEINSDLMICHGSPLDEDDYIFTEYDAFRAFQAFPHRIFLFGHTHVPMICEFSDTGMNVILTGGNDFKFKLDSQARYMINPGSIGQPRDRNPMAAYALLDDKRNTFLFKRVPYDIEASQGEIRKAGLPEILAKRLGEGM